MTKTLQITGVIVLAILAIDFLAFLLWIVSGQTPVDEFYIGSITSNILQAIIF